MIELNSDMKYIAT